MEDLLDDIDELVTPGLSTDAPNWCASCQSLRQELKQLKDDHCQNFSKLKQKIINTDLLIKKFKAKCDDYDLQCKRTEEANKRADKFQRQCEILESQLKAALLDTEPLRKTKVTLEEELYAKKTECQSLSDRLIATEIAQKQYEQLSKTNSANLMQLEEEKRELLKKIKLFETGKLKRETVKEFKNEIQLLKKENSSLQKENEALKKTGERLEKRVLSANKNIDELNKTIKELGTRRKMSPVKSPFRSPRFGRYKSPTKSPVCKKIHPPASTSKVGPCEQKLEFITESSLDDTDDDDDDSVCSVTWTFSPITQCISPLPPSPAGFVNQNDIDGNVSDIADDLEQFLDEDNENNPADDGELETTLTDSTAVKTEKLVQQDLESTNCSSEQVDLVKIKPTHDNTKENSTVNESEGSNNNQHNVNNYEINIQKSNNEIKSQGVHNTENVSNRTKVSLESYTSDVTKTNDNTDEVKNSVENDETVKHDEPHLEISDNKIVSIDKVTTTPDKSDALKEQDILWTEKSESVLRTTENSRQSLKERIAGSIEIMSPTALKKSSSPLKVREGKSPLKLGGGKNNSVDSVKSGTRTPFIRRSARIQSKRDSETSEAESDSNTDKTSHSMKTVSTTKSEISHKINTNSAGVVQTAARVENSLKIVIKSENSDDKDEKGSDDIEKRSRVVKKALNIKSENLDETKNSLDVSNECVENTSKDLNKSLNTQNNVPNKIIADNSDTSITSLQNTKTTDLLANNDIDNCKNSGKDICNTEDEKNECNDKIDSSNDIKEQGLELSEGIEIDVWKEMQTEAVIPKPLPKQSCLVRQSAVSNTSHLFNDLQAIRSKQTGNKNNSNHTSKSKSKFSVNDFIPFQRSSAGTLSNEIDNLHTEHDYDLVSREEVKKQPVELPERVSKYVKGLQKKMKRTCKYVDFDSEGYDPHNKSKVTNHKSPSNNLDQPVLGSSSSGKSNSAADSHTPLQPTSSVKATESAPSVKTDSKQSLRSPKGEVISTTPDNLGIQCDKTSANVKINKIETMDHVASNKDKETSDEQHDPSDDCIDRTDKIVPSRQLSTGFSITSASFERTSSTESGVSLRCSPAKLFSLELGSCDTILEDVDENGVDVIKDEPDCNNDGDKDDNVIFGVEDIMNNEHDTTYDTTDNKPPQSLIQKCAQYKTMDNTINTESEFVKSIDEPSVNTDIMDVKPGCSGYNTEKKNNSEEHLFTKFKEEKFNPSKFATDEFTSSSNESSRSSFGLLGRDSPMSDMFLSNFEFLNPVSPLPPSPVRELEDNTAAEDLYDDVGECENQPVDSENNYTGKNENAKRLLSKKYKVKDNKCKAKTKGKALLKKSKDSSNKVQLPFSSLDTLNDKVKIESENMLKDTPDTSEASHIKVENLKMSPLPGMISPVKSPSVKQCPYKLGKKITKLERRVKREHNIMDDCDRVVQSEVDDDRTVEVGAGDTLVNMKSKTFIEKTVISDSSAEIGDGVTKKRKISFGKKQKSDKITAPSRRKSALVDQILRKRTEANKQNEIEKTQKDIVTSSGKNTNSVIKGSKTCIKSDANVNVNVPTEQLQPAEVSTAKENEGGQEVRGTPHVADTSVDEKGDQNVLEELPTGHDNLAFKKKNRVAHKPNMQPLKPQKVQVIEAPHLPPVLRGRKRKSIDGMNKDGQDKKPKSSFRKQKNETCVKKEDTRRMQAFLKSTDLADKLVTMVTGIHKAERVGNILLLSCLECIGRVMTDPLDIVYENCITDTYSSINTDFPFLSDVEKRAVYLIRHLLDNQLIGKDQLMRSAWDTVLCRNLTVNVIGKMAQCRLFIALCAVQGDLELARVTLYQLVTCTYLNFILFIVPVVSVWPEVLRKSPEDQPDVVVNHGLTLVLEELITERLLSTNDELSKKILLILQKLCLWSGVCGTSESVLHMLFTKLKACTSEESGSDCAVFELTKALNLLCSSKPWSWVKLNFIEKHGLQSAAYKYTAKLITIPIPAKYMCAVLRTTSYILSVHASTIRERDYQQIIRNWILPVLKKKQCDPEVLLCCIETLIELTPLYLPCLEMIQRWFQETKHTVSDELVVRLEDLRMQYKQQFGLQCKPFIKS